LADEDGNDDSGCIEQRRCIEALAIHRHRQRDDHERLQQHQLADSGDATHCHRCIEYKKREELTDQAHIGESGPGGARNVTKVGLPEHESRA